MKKQYPDAKLDMTPMIDVVFQLIIFFVVTAAMQDKAMETNVLMAMAPNGPVETVKDPRTVTVDVVADGKDWRATVRIQPGPAVLFAGTRIEITGPGRDEEFLNRCRPQRGRG